MIFYKPLEKTDLTAYEHKTRPEFTPDDWCDAAYLAADWDSLRAFILYDGDAWAGFCALTLGRPHDFNPNGAHFLQIVTFEPFRGKGYTHYLYKLLFNASRGFYKTACIHADNFASVNAAQKYGFKRVGTHKQWDLYACESNYVPDFSKEIIPEKRNGLT